MKTKILCLLFFSQLIGHVANAQYDLKFKPETSTSYASMFVYSTQTGEFQYFIVKEKGKWTLSTSLPALPITITKEDLKMEYYPETTESYACIFLYSSKTGEFQLFTLKEKGKWTQITDLPPLPITITKEGLNLEYIKETASTFAVMNVFSSKTGEFQRFTLKEKGKWTLNTEIPELVITIK